MEMFALPVHQSSAFRPGYALILHRKDRKELETKMMEKERIEEIEFPL